jgi:hypothetical protein
VFQLRSRLLFLDLTAEDLGPHKVVLEPAL